MNSKTELCRLANSKGYNKFSPIYSQTEDINPSIWLLELTLIQQWLREVHRINVIVYPLLLNGSITYYCWDVYTELSHAYAEAANEHITYEEALEFGLIEALKLI